MGSRSLNERSVSPSIHPQMSEIEPWKFEIFVFEN